MFKRFAILMLAATLATTGWSDTIEEQIRAGKTSTAALLVSSHPRLWMKGQWEWNKNNYGSFAWRVAHGEALQPLDLNNDQSKYEFSYCTSEHHGGAYSADEMFGHRGWGDYGRRLLEPIIAGKAVANRAAWNFPADLPGSSNPDDYSPDHTSNEYYHDAREKLLTLVNSPTGVDNSLYIVIYGAVAYDWLMGETLQNGAPILSGSSATDLQQGILRHANYLKNQINGKEHFFVSSEIHNYMYVMAGLALYEPSRVSDPAYAAINAQAKALLDDLDKYWVGKILPALNAQGGDGGWHGGMSRLTAVHIIAGSPDNRDNNVLVNIAPLLFAHYTATNAPIEKSLFSTGVMKYMIEFQNHMIRPSGDQYYEIGGATGEWDRAPWIFPRRFFSRRRFSADPEQQRLGELGAWLGVAKRPYFHSGPAGSWDTIDQLLFEDKWPNPRMPANIGFDRTRHFQKLGWVFMRSAFSSPDDLAALFICQRYHWSHLDPYAQNSFTLERKGKLIEGFDNTIKIDNQGQRLISQDVFPTLALGVQAYGPGTIFDVGPGVLKFESSDKYDYMMGDATNAYDKSKLERFTRQIVYLKPNKFIVFDRVLTKSANTKKSWVINPAAAPQAFGQGVTLINNGAGALWIKRLLPQQVSETMNADRIEVVPSQPATEHLFLHVMQTAEAGQSKDSPNVKADNAKLFAYGSWIGVRIGADSVHFNASGSLKVTAGTDSLDEGDDGLGGDGEPGFMPLDFELQQNTPNPVYAKSQTDINYNLHSNTNINLSIFTLSGQRVTVLVNEKNKPGYYKVSWDGKDASGHRVPTGVYLYRLTTDRNYQIKKMLVLR